MKTLTGEVPVFFNDEDSVAAVAELLLADKVGVIPADTIYGLSGRANEVVSEKLYEAKRRPKSKNFIILSSIERLQASNLIIPPVLFEHWPCSLTAIVNTKEGTTQAVRVPNDDFIQAVVALAGPIWSTSVNISGEPSLMTFDDIYSKFGSALDFYTRKKEECLSALPSTMIDCTVRPFCLIRQGSYNATALLI